MYTGIGFIAMGIIKEGGEPLLLIPIGFGMIIGEYPPPYTQV